MKNTHDCQQPSDNDLVEKLRKLLRRYFETDVNGDPIPEHEPNYSAQDIEALGIKCRAYLV